MESGEYIFGNPDAGIVLIQPVDGHSLRDIEQELSEIRKLTDKDFCLQCARVENWNDELSPWEASSVFGKDGFGGQAEETLKKILGLTVDKSKIYYIGGYSLAGLFALWSAYQTDIFKGVAAASPSMWFPGFTDYMKAHVIQTGAVYFSLGDREEKTRNPVMASVGDRIREAEGLLKGQEIKTVLEMNPGNHFTDVGLRTAKAFAWVLSQ